MGERKERIHVGGYRVFQNEFEENRNGKKRRRSNVFDSCFLPYAIILSNFIHNFVSFHHIIKLPEFITNDMKTGSAHIITEGLDSSVAKCLKLFFCTHGTFIVCHFSCRYHEFDELDKIKKTWTLRH